MIKTLVSLLHCGLEGKEGTLPFIDFHQSVWGTILPRSLSIDNVLSRESTMTTRKKVVVTRASTYRYSMKIAATNGFQRARQLFSAKVIVLRSYQIRTPNPTTMSRFFWYRVDEALCGFFGLGLGRLKWSLNPVAGFALGELEAESGSQRT